MKVKTQRTIAYLLASTLIVGGAFGGVASAVVPVMAAEQSYEILTGQNTVYTKGSNTVFAAEINASSSEFIHVAVDGQVLDASLISVEEIKKDVEAPTTEAPNTEVPKTEVPSETPTTEPSVMPSETPSTEPSVMPTAEVPTATTEPPATTSEAPAATTEAPAATSEAPAATSEAPAATSEAPVATSEAPAATSEAPVATSEAPTTAEAPAVTGKAGVGYSFANTFVVALKDVFSGMTVHAASANYTKITITASYLETLSKGDHTVVYKFANGSASTTLKVEDASKSAKKHKSSKSGNTEDENTVASSAASVAEGTNTVVKDTVPKTGVNQYSDIFALISIVSGIGIIYFERKRKTNV